MELALELISTALLVVLATAHVRRVPTNPFRHHRTMLERHVGTHLRLVGGETPVEGLVRRVSRRDVAVRVRGTEVSVPFDRIAEVWEGRRLLARW